MTTSDSRTNAHCVKTVSSIVAEALIPNLPEFDEEVSLVPDDGAGDRNINIGDVVDVLVRIDNTEATPFYSRQTTHQIKQIVDYLQNDFKQNVSGSPNLNANVADVCSLDSGIGSHIETSFTQPDRDDKSPGGQFANYPFPGLDADQTEVFRPNTARSDPIPVPGGPHRHRYVSTCSSGSASVTSPMDGSPYSPHAECAVKGIPAPTWYSEVIDHSAPKWYSEVIEHSQMDREFSLPRESKVEAGLGLNQLTSWSTQGHQKMDAYIDPVFSLEEDEEQGDNTGKSEEEEFEIPDSVGCDELRKMRSKLAAKRCRDKKKRREEKLKKELLHQMSLQTKIKFEIHQLEKVKERLRRALVSHDCKRFPWLQRAPLTQS